MSPLTSCHCAEEGEGDDSTQVGAFDGLFDDVGVGFNFPFDIAMSLETPSGGFIDNGLHDLNVNSGNYGLALAADTIWFTRANNQNGTLRAVTIAQDVPPVTDGPFPPQ